MKKITIIVDDEDSFSGNILNNIYYNPCENCMNNPKNNPNASGICCCSLPDLYNPVL